MLKSQRTAATSRSKAKSPAIKKGRTAAKPIESATPIKSGKAEKAGKSNKPSKPSSHGKPKKPYLPSVETFSTKQNPPGNPVMFTLAILSHYVERHIQDTVDEILGIDDAMPDVHSRLGTIRIRSNKDGYWYKERTATNEECAVWSVELRGEGKFDLRKPLPPQVAKWLRKQSAALIAAADNVETIEDDRDRRLIRKIVHDVDYLPGIIADGMEFDHDGSLIPDWRIEARAQLAKLEAEGGAA